MIYAGAMQNLALQIQTSHDFQHTKAFMIKETMDLVTEIYAQDFEMYPYTKGIF